MEYFMKDKDIERSVLASSVMFHGKKFKDARNRLLHKQILALVLAKKASSLQDIMAYLHKSKKDTISEDVVRKTLHDLQKDGLVNGDEFNIIIPDKERTRIESRLSEIGKSYERLLKELTDKVKSEFTGFGFNYEQVKFNIKKCIDYYFEVAGLSVNELDSRSEISKFSKLKDIALTGLTGSDKELLASLIIQQIGIVIDSPTPEQQKVFEILGRNYLTAQIMSIDPLLVNFKQEILRNKVFVLDTDIVLYLLSPHTPKGQQYAMLFEHLKKLGCELYVPKDVLLEIFDHAEMANRKHGISITVVEEADANLTSEFHNVFQEEYHYLKQNSPKEDNGWDLFIGNFYNRKHNAQYTIDQVKEFLGDDFHYEELPVTGILESKDFEPLYAKSLERTTDANKGIGRDMAQNEQLAKTDTVLYLSVKALNQAQEEQNSTSEILKEKYYLLTESNRIHWCAVDIGVSANVLYKPQAIIAYLAETGFCDDTEIEITKLFDNVFLQYTADLVWNDISKLVSAGIAIKGKNVVRLRYEYHDIVINDLSEDKPVEFDEVYGKVIRRGGQFQTDIQRVVEANGRLNDDLEKTKKENEELRRQVDNAKKFMDEVNKRRGNKHVLKSKKKKGKKK